MKENVNQLTLTEQDKHHLFLLHEHADDLERTMSKCDAVTDIFEEALERMSSCGTRPSDDTTIIDVVRVIHDYSNQAKQGIRELESNLSIFNSNLHSKGGECNE